jgi:metallo-beta-lactamase class B
MKAALPFAVLLAGCAQTASVQLAAPPATAATVDAHVARAQQLAGNDLKNLMRLCQAQPADRAEPSPAMDDALRQLIAKPAPPPMQVFDNLYYVGAAWVSAWLLKTSEGFVLIDALNNAAEAQALIEGGMIKLGLDPREIKYIVVTHGHGDHYGGANYLVEKYKPRVIASVADWNMMHGTLEFNSTVWGPPPLLGIEITKDGEQMKFGDTTMTFYVTTGHTLGTLSPMFDVKSGGKTYHALLWGGTSFNFGNDYSRLASYIANTERMREFANRMPIDVLLSNHSDWDNSIVKMNAMRAAGPNAKNAFITGPQVVDRSMQVMGECARAQSDRFRM